MYIADGGTDIEDAKSLIEEALDELGYAIVNVDENSAPESRIDEIMTDLEETEDEKRVGHLRKYLDRAYQKMDGSNGSHYNHWRVSDDAEEYLEEAYDAIEGAKDLLEN